MLIYETVLGFRVRPVWIAGVTAQVEPTEELIATLLIT